MDIFCKIMNGDIPSYTIFEDDIVKVFLDVNPKVNGHALVVPKRHFKDLYDIDDKTLLHIFKVAREISPKMAEVLKADGITLTENNGLYQVVKHFHLHILPQYKEKKEILDIKDVYELLTK